MTAGDFTRAVHVLFGVLADFWESLAFSYAVTVLIPDYKRAESEGLVLPRAEAICADHALEFLVVPTRDDLPIFLYFDQTERFMHPIRRVWQRARRGGRERRGWPSDIAQI